MDTCSTNKAGLHGFYRGTVLAIVVAAVSLLVGISSAGAGDFEEVAKLEPAGHSRNFGDAVALDGMDIYVGAYDTNVVYAYKRNEHGDWIEAQAIQRSGYDPYNGFGKSVALDGTYGFVGDPFDKDPDDPGSLYVLGRNNDDVWIEEAKLLPANGSEVDGFGWAVAADDDTMIVGAPFTDIDSESRYVGAAYVFELRQDGVWHQQAKLIPDPPIPGEEFGKAVALDGNTALVGTGYWSEVVAAYVFSRDSTGTWTQDAALKPTGSFWRLEGWGSAVALDGQRALIGFTTDMGEDAEGRPQWWSRSAYVFERNATGAWQQVAELRQFTEDRPTTSYPTQDASLALDGDIAAIGVPVAASVWIYTFEGNGQWEETQRLRFSGPLGVREGFGNAVAIDGTVLVVGRPNCCDDIPSAAYVYERPGPTRNVHIDVKPFNKRNPINPRSRGRFWVAILSEEGFDPLQVDPGTVAFGPGAASPDRYKVKDGNADRIPDLLLRFRTPAVGLQCDDKELELTGETYAGHSIIGSDAVKTVGCKKPKKGRKK